MLHHAKDYMRSPAYRTGAFALLLAIAVIGGALAFQHLGGLAPCPLCLEQRYAYYVGVPALFAALVLLATGRSCSATALFLLVSLAFLANAALGTYHAGVEWKFWAGPETCSGTGTQPLGSGSGGVLGSLANTRVVRCDEIPWQFMGLSLAGWNVVASLLLAACSASAAVKALRS